MRLYHDGRLIGPFVYSLERTRDPDTVLHMHSHLPLWMGLTAALPPQWPALRVYFGTADIDLPQSQSGYCGYCP